MYLVLLEFNDGESPEIYGPFATQDAAADWAARIKQSNERVVRAEYGTPLTPTNPSGVPGWVETE